LRPLTSTKKKKTASSYIAFLLHPYWYVCDHLQNHAHAYVSSYVFNVPAFTGYIRFAGVSKMMNFQSQLSALYATHRRTKTLLHAALGIPWITHCFTLAITAAVILMYAVIHKLCSKYKTKASLD
jgi:hypothetical protein